MRSKQEIKKSQENWLLDRMTELKGGGADSKGDRGGNEINMAKTFPQLVTKIHSFSRMLLIAR